jgi:hypothetical protein
VTVQYAEVGAIIAYLLAEGALGTADGHFESLDYQPEVEAAHMLE